MSSSPLAIFDHPRFRFLLAAIFIGIGGLGVYAYGRFLPSVAEKSQNAVFELFGLGLPMIVFVLVFVAYLVISNRFWPFPFHWRYGPSALVGGLVIFGLLGMIRPDQKLGGVSLKTFTAGGSFGHGVAGDPDLPGILKLLVLFFALYSIIWPGRARALIASSWNFLVRAGKQSPAAAKSVIEKSKTVKLPKTAMPKMPALSRSESTPLKINVPIDDVFEPEPAPAPVAPPKQKKQAQPRQQITVEETFVSTQLPPIDVLEQPPAGKTSPVDIDSRVRQIEGKLAEYGVDAKVIEVNQGPTITQFGIEPGWEVKTREVRERDQDGRFKYDKDGNPKVHLEEVSRVRVKVSKILALANDLALALAVPSVRIEAPVPGKSVVGLEVPNVASTMVSLRRVIETPAFQKLRGKTKLALALGQDVAGSPVVADLGKMPHCLIAGATGAGKSVCVNAIIASILMHSTPEEVRLLMVDPKRVELAGYNEIPHLLAPVIVDAPKVVGVLRWVLQEMEDRYKSFAELGVRNLEGYNQRRVRDGELIMPCLVVIIDELADLMMVASEEVERIIVRLAQLARATGIHLIIATQRPSVDVVTGLIKANVPTRIAFAVSSQIDSRTILDQVGAEKLLGRGDMLYAPPDAAKPVRLQGVFVSDSEIDKLTAWWRAVRPPQYIEELVNMPETGPAEQNDPLLEQARQLADEHERISTSFLQRRLRIGYNRAARLMDKLEDEGTVEPPDSRRAVAAGLGD